MLNILYISALCSENLLDKIFSSAKVKPQLAAQKFHRLLAEGLASYPTSRITTISSVPVTPTTHQKKLWVLPSETKKNVTYRYIPFLNLPLIKESLIFIHSFFFILFWPLFNRKNRVIMVDVLNLVLVAAAILSTRINRVKCIGMVTDIPGQMVAQDNADMTLKARLYNKLTFWCLTRLDAYILLTEQMNDVVNPNQRPYTIMEGLVDKSENLKTNELESKNSKKEVLYAGGLFERYGLATLIKAFTKTHDPMAELHLYGKGDMVESIKVMANKDSRIRFHGLVPNKIVVNHLPKATLLVNPRPTKEEFTKYSFPSKNMEYMVSGTPIVTTKLPGMPTEYLDFIYLFDDESVDGMANTLNKLLAIPRNELHTHGEKARKFVLDKKNNAKQATHIINFMNNL